MASLLGLKADVVEVRAPEEIPAAVAKAKELGSKSFARAGVRSP